MTRRHAVRLFAAGLGAAVALPAATPAPARARVSAPDARADLTGLHALIGKAVEAGSWPADEAAVRAAVQTLVDRAQAAAGRTGWPLPVDFAKLATAPVANPRGAVDGRGLRVVGGDVKGGAARGSVVLASGAVEYTALEDCVVVGKTVRFTGGRNCVVIAAEQVRATSADGCVLAAGRWVRLTAVGGGLCHVLHPGREPAPGDRPGGPPAAVVVVKAEQVSFLNPEPAVFLGQGTDCTVAAPKAALAK